MWVNVHEDDLVSALREQTEPDQAEAIRTRSLAAQAAALDVIDNAAWVERLDDWLSRLRHVPALDETAKIGWISTWDVRCGIAQYSAFILSSLGDEHRDRIRILCDWRTSANEEGASYRAGRCSSPTSRKQFCARSSKTISLPSSCSIRMG